MLDNSLCTIAKSSFNKATFVHLMPYKKSNGSLQYGINGTSNEPTDVIITSKPTLHSFGDLTSL